MNLTTIPTEDDLFNILLKEKKREKIQMKINEQKRYKALQDEHDRLNKTKTKTKIKTIKKSNQKFDQMLKNKDLSCLNFKASNVKLHPYQKLPSTFIMNPSNRGLLLFYGLGTGKTLTSIAMIKCLLNKYPNKNVLVLTPANLITNYINELDKVSKDLNPFIHKINVESYGKFANKIKKFHLKADHNTIIVFDESHNLLSKSSVRFKLLFEFSKQAFKIILLSGTPVRNNISEIANELSLLNGYNVKSSTIYNANIESNPHERLRSLYKLFKCKIAIYNKPDHTKSSGFAQKTEHDVRLVMSNEYYQRYYEIQKNIAKNLPKVFENTKDFRTYLNGVRRATNILSYTLISPKIAWVIQKIKKDLRLIPGYTGEPKKILIYSNWVSSGIDLIKNELDNLNIKYSEISGKIKKNKKDSNLNDYNNDKTNVMIITSSGAEGISLKNTRSVIILEPYWNSQRPQQVIARAIRLGSHSSLPIAQQKVDVYNLILEKPKSVLRYDQVPSADDLLYNYTKYKDVSINNFYNQLKKISIENDKYCF